jgi:type II secretory pathway pseudopilin PulG
MKRAIESGRRARTRSFSLIEVVIALGVIAVGVVAILGVFPTALQTGHSAQDETRAPEIAQTIYGSLVAQASSQFSNMRFLLSDGATLFPTPPSPAIDLTAAPATVQLYADNDGKLTQDATTAAYIIFIFTNNSPPGFPTPPPAYANQVTVRVAWPANAPAGNQTYRDYVRTISKY